MALRSHCRPSIREFSCRAISPQYEGRIASLQYAHGTHQEGAGNVGSHYGKVRPLAAPDQESQSGQIIHIRAMKYTLYGDGFAMDFTVAVAGADGAVRMQTDTCTGRGSVSASVSLPLTSTSPPQARRPGLLARCDNRLRDPLRVARNELLAQGVLYQRFYTIVCVVRLAPGFRCATSLSILYQGLVDSLSTLVIRYIGSQCFAVPQFSPTARP